MPELHFEVRWPDGSQERYYSPSTIIRAHLTAGQSYPVSEFVAHARDALMHASERVRAKFGYACSSAQDTLNQIETRAADFAELGDQVHVLAIQGPPLTAPTDT